MNSGCLFYYASVTFFNGGHFLNRKGHEYEHELPVIDLNLNPLLFLLTASVKCLFLQLYLFWGLATNIHNLILTATLDMTLQDHAPQEFIFCKKILIISFYYYTWPKMHLSLTVIVLEVRQEVNVVNPN